MATQLPENSSTEGGGTEQPLEHTDSITGQAQEGVIDLTTERSNKRPPPATSPAPDLQADVKKLHRDDSMNSTLSSDERDIMDTSTVSSTTKKAESLFKRVGASLCLCLISS